MEVAFDYFVLFLVNSFLNNLIRRLCGQSVFYSQEALEKLLDTTDVVLFYLHIQALKGSVLVQQLLQTVQINKR